MAVLQRVIHGLGDHFILQVEKSIKLFSWKLMLSILKIQMQL